MDIQSPRPISPMSCAQGGGELMPVDQSKPGLWLADHARTVRAYTLLESSSRDLLSLPAELREKMMGPAVKKSLYAATEKKNWQVSTYRSCKRELHGCPEDESPSCYQNIMEHALALRDQVKITAQRHESEALEKNVPVSDVFWDDFVYQPDTGSIIAQPEPQAVPDESEMETAPAPRERLSFVNNIWEAFEYMEHTGQINFAYNQDDLVCQQPDRHRPELFFCDPDTDYKFGTLQVTLPDLNDVPDGKWLIVHFDRPLLEASPDDVSKKTGSKRGGQNKYTKVQLMPVASGNRYKGVRSSADPVNLNPQEWAVFRKNSSNWELEFKVVRQAEKLLTNPLALEQGPLLVDQNDHLEQPENNGEYYLNREMLTSLYQEKVDRAIEKAGQQGIDYEPLPWCHQVSFANYQQLAELGDNYHFMFERSNLAHTIGVYVKVDRKTNEVNVYLHETEGAEEPASKRIRTQMLGMMENLYPGMQINLFYPKEVLQRDYASCGVFTLKAMNYFRKHPQEMDDWMTAMKSQGHDAGGCAIPLSMMKPGLLKIFQRRLEPRNPLEPAITSAQLEQPVCKDGTKLYDYLFKYEREVVKTDGKTTTAVNTGPLVKRYEMMEEYQQISDRRERAKLTGPCTLTVETILPESAPLKRKRVRKTHDVDCPQHIIDSVDRDEVNDWLATQGDERFSRKEWQSIGRYNRYGGATQELKEKHKESYRWLKKARKESDTTTPRGFLLTQWLAVSQTKAKRKAK